MTTTFDDNNDNEVEDDHDGSTADGDAVREISCSELPNQLMCKKQNMSCFISWVFDFQ